MPKSKSFSFRVTVTSSTFSFSADNSFLSHTERKWQFSLLLIELLINPNFTLRVDHIQLVQKGNLVIKFYSLVLQGHSRSHHVNLGSKPLFFAKSNLSDINIGRIGDFHCCMSQPLANNCVTYIYAGQITQMSVSLNCIRLETIKI